MKCKILELDGTADEVRDVLERLGHVNTHNIHAPQPDKDETPLFSGKEGFEMPAPKAKRKSPTGGDWSKARRDEQAARAKKMWAARKRSAAKIEALKARTDPAAPKNNDARNAEIVSLRKQGLKYGEIAAKMKMHKGTVFVVCKKAGLVGTIETTNTRIDDAMKEKVFKLREAGKSFDEIGVALDIARSTAHRIVRTHEAETGRVLAPDEKKEAETPNEEPKKEEPKAKSIMERLFGGDEDKKEEPKAEGA